MTNDCLPSIGSDNGQAGSSASRICTEKRASSDPWIAGEKPTWSQKLTAHPHVHCVVPAGGLSADHTRWIKPRYDFFLPIKVLSQLMTLSLDEFLRRFLLHLLPEGFVRIRNFGFLADRKRATTLPLSFQLLGGAPQTEPETPTAGHGRGMKRLSPNRKCFPTHSVPLCLPSERLSFSRASIQRLEGSRLRFAADAGPMQIQWWEGAASDCAEAVLQSATRDSMRPEVGRMRKRIVSSVVEELEHTVLVLAPCPSHFRYNPEDFPVLISSMSGLAIYHSSRRS
jgi:hypothetical protein